MTDYEQLVEALRCCASGACDSEKCDYMRMGAYGCMIGLAQEAADAIEALDRLLDQNTQRCEALRKQLREAHESYEKHLSELEAQLPKHGKWIPIQIGKWRGHKCSCCGTAREVPCSSSDGIPQWKYCPECGAKMREVQE